MKEHNGENPQNARIKISYKGKKPKVNFSYPIDKKNTSTRGSMATTIIGGCAFCFLIYVIISGGMYATNLDQYEPNELEKFSVCVAQNPIQTYTNYSNVRNNICKPNEIIFISLIKSLIEVSFFLLILPSLIYFPFKKKWNKLYPDWQALTTFKK